MFIKSRSILLFLPMLIAVGLACNQPTNGTNKNSSQDNVIAVIDSSSPVVTKVQVMATTSIVMDWVKQVGGNRIYVDSIVPDSVNPHSYQPGAKDVVRITQAKQIFAVGLMYERLWLTKLLESYPELNVVKLGNFIEPIEFNDGEIDHDGHDEHGHHNAEFDPHFWFDPTRVSLAVTKITNVLSGIDPAGAAYYEERAAQYLTSLNELDRHIANEILRIPVSKRRIITEHESLGYLGDRYNVEIFRAIIPSLSSESGPTPKDLVRAIDLINKYNIPVIFIENETNDKSAERVVEETDIKLAKGLSVETLTDGQTYIDLMKYNIAIIVSNLVD